MGVYLRAKLQVSSIILTSFRQGVILPSLSLQNEPLKNPHRLGLKVFDKTMRIHMSTNREKPNN